MLKTVRFFMVFFLLPAACGFCAAQQIPGYKNMKSTKIKVDYVDFNIYPKNSIEGKGVLYAYNTSLAERQLQIGVFDEKGDLSGIWYVGGGMPSVYKKSVPEAAEIFISAGDVFNAIDKGDNYLISALVLSHEGYETVALTVSKQQVESLGFKYIPLEDVIEICRKNFDMAKNVVGSEIKLSPAELKKIQAKDNAPYLLSRPGEEITFVNPSGNEPPKRKIYMLRIAPSLSAQFVDIEEPKINDIRILFKKDYWYELEVTSLVLFAASSAESDVYRGKIYRGFWQAQYDANGFPVLLSEMVIGSWKELAGQYLEKQSKKQPVSRAR